MKIALIAGNRLLPVILARAIFQSDKGREIVGICFKGETSREILPYLTRAYWINPGELGKLRKILSDENITQAVMAGQISPWRIFFPQYWDKDLTSLIAETKNFCPHTIFTKIIDFIEAGGVRFIDSTIYLKDVLATRGLMNNISPDINITQDIEFGVEMSKRYVDLDIGQTIVIKDKAVVAAEALEGTDNTIKRAGRVAGAGTTVIKFSKSNQDMRFDVPVVGLRTLAVLRNIKASALVLESCGVLILEREKFLEMADKWRISVFGQSRE